MYKTSLLYGLIGGVIAVIYSLLLYIIGFETYSSTGLQMIGWVIIIVAMIMGGLKLRKERGGYLSYGESYVSSLLTAAVATLVTTVFIIILFHVIDPSLMDKMSEKAIEQTIVWMEKFGAPEAEIEKAIQKLEEDNSFGVGRLLGNWIWMLIMWAIISLLIALVAKKNNPNPMAEELIED